MHVQKVILSAASPRSKSLNIFPPPCAILPLRQYHRYLNPHHLTHLQLSSGLGRCVVYHCIIAPYHRTVLAQRVVSPCRSAKQPNVQHLMTRVEEAKSVLFELEDTLPAHVEGVPANNSHEEWWQATSTIRVSRRSGRCARATGSEANSAHSERSWDRGPFDGGEASECV